MAEDEQRDSGSGTGDLFEELDSFFSSMDDAAWPQDSAPVADRTEPIRVEDPEEPIVVPDVAPAAAVPPVSAPSPARDQPVGPQLVGGTDPARQPPSKAESGGDMSNQDWRRLRDVLGHEDEVEDDVAFREPSIGAEGESAAPPLPADRGEDAPTGGVEGPPEAIPVAAAPDGPGASEPPPPEITVEDLKKAPPQYEELPKSEVEGIEPAGLPAWPPPEARPEEAPPPPPSVSAPPEPGGPQPATEDVVEGDAPARQPSLAEVEAAADQLAAEFVPVPGGVEEDLLRGLDTPPGPRTIKVGEPEGMVGPSWEEPSSHTLSPEAPPPTEPGRNVQAAVISAVVLAAVAIMALLVAKWAFAIVVGVVALAGQAELYTAFQAKSHLPATALGLVLGALTMAGAYLWGEQGIPLFLSMGLILCFLWYMSAAPKARNGAVVNVGLTLLGLVYVPVLASYILLILSQQSHGRGLVLAVLGLTFLYDAAAYGVGRWWGSRALAPTISPRKSWEGLLGATVVTFAFGIALVPIIEPMSVGKAVGLTLVVVVFAPLGDLAESALKRDLGLKDMGTILPGHGGVLDRIDSALFVAPAAFYFLRLIFK